MKEWKKVAVILGFGSFTDATDFAVLYTALAMLQIPWNIQPWQYGIIASIPTYIGLCTSFLAGPLADYFGRRKVWVIGNLFPGIAYLVGAFFCQTWFDLVIVRCIGVIGQCTTLVIYYAWLPEVVPADKRQTVMGFAGILTLCSGLVLSAILALTAIFPWIDFRMLFIYTAVADLIATAAGVVFLREPEMWVERRKMIKEGRAPVEQQKVSYRALITGKYGPATVVGIIIGCIWSMFGVLTASSMTMGTHFSIVVMQYPPWLMGVLGLIGYPVGMVIRPLVGYVSDRIGRLKNLLLFTVIGVPAAILYGFGPYIVGVGPQLHVIVYMYILGTITSLGSSGQEDTGKLVLSEAVPTVARGSAQGLLELIKGLVMGTLSLIAASVYEIYGPSWGICFSWILGAIIGIPVVLVAMKMGLERARKELE
ncbi:MAG: MFS transporter [Candidatus Bathyarchaeia archaeon]